MNLLGAHMSIAGGIHNAIDRGAELGCTAIQIFVKSSKRLFGKPMDNEAIEQWYLKMEGTNKPKHNIQRVLVHAGYLINIASPENEKWEKYIEALADEMLRCEILGISNIIIHPGSPGDKGEKWGINRVAQALDRLYNSYDIKVNIALENTAGMGYQLGWCFEHMHDIISSMKCNENIGIVLDTCHTFAAGYEFATEKSYERTWTKFDDIIGFNRLVALHLNDSRYPYASRKDHHAHIGRGFMGIEPFRLIMCDERLKKLPKIIETPKENDWDRKNLKLLRELAK